MIVTLECEGKQWNEWESLQVQKSLDRVQHSFSMTTTDAQQSGYAQWNVRGGSSVTLKMDETPILTGVVQRYTTSETGTTSSIIASGESVAIDLVQGGYEGPYYWREVSGERMVADVMARYGLRYSIDAPMSPAPFEGFRVGPEQKAYQVLKAIAERDALLVWSDPSGVVHLSQGADGPYVGQIQRGDWTSIDVEFDQSESYSKVIIKGQKNNFGEDLDSAYTNRTVVDNAAVTRYRPLIIVAADDEAVQKARAEYIARRQAGRMVKATVTVKSAYAPSGAVWDIGQIVHIHDKRLSLNDRLVVDSVAFILDEGGFSIQLGLRTPLTYSTAAVSPREARRGGGLFPGWPP